MDKYIKCPIQCMTDYADGSVGVLFIFYFTNQRKRHLRDFHREFENDILVSKRVVNLGEGVELGLYVNKVLGI